MKYVTGTYFTLEAFSFSAINLLEVAGTELSEVDFPGETLLGEDKSLREPLASEWGLPESLSLLSTEVGI